MARASAFVAGMALGLLLGTAIMVSHADPAEAEVDAAAAEAHVAVTDLLGAMATTEIADPYVYLRSVGELPPLRPPPAPPRAAAASPLVECIIAHESRGYAGAVNARSGASGLGQFLPSTWRTTPQGRAGLSVFDPGANRAAVAWMLSVGRGREFSTLGLCR